MPPARLSRTRIRDESLSLIAQTNPAPRPSASSRIPSQFLSGCGWQERAWIIAGCDQATDNYHKLRRSRLRNQLRRLSQTIGSADEDVGDTRPLPHPTQLLCDYSISHMGEWAAGFDARLSAVAKRKSSNSTLAESIKRDNEVASECHSPNMTSKTREVNHSAINENLKPVAREVKAATPNATPDLVSDHSSPQKMAIEKRELEQSNDLEDLAIHILKFWRAGVAIYLAHPQSTGQAVDINASKVTASQSASNTENHKRSRTSEQQAIGNDEGVSEGATPTVSVKQRGRIKAFAVLFRCLVEASFNDHSCDKCNIQRFDSMLRHIKLKHPHIYYLEHYHGRSFEQLLRDVRWRLNGLEHHSDERVSATLFTLMFPDRPVPYLRFIKLSKSKRQEELPPPIPYFTSLHLPSISSPQDQILGADHIESNTLSQAASASSLPDAGDSADINRTHPPEQVVPAANMRVAARNFAAAMKADPLFATQVRRIYHQLNVQQEEADEEKEMIDLEVDHKRKESEADDGWSQPGTDSAVKRARYLEFRAESRARKKSINRNLSKQLDEAERKMTELYKDRNTDTTLPLLETDNAFGKVHGSVLPSNPVFNEAFQVNGLPALPGDSPDLNQNDYFDFDFERP